MKQYEFFNLLRRVKQDVYWRYSYSFGNDEFRNCSKWQRRTADYEFRMYNLISGENHTLQKGTTRGCVYELKEKLEAKYSKWMLDFTKLPPMAKINNL